MVAETIFDAVKQAGVRALVSAGWGGLGETDIPENVFILKGKPPSIPGIAADLRQGIYHTTGSLRMAE